eukprot:1160451-Pelagomonas_calceolata.AAC.8
MERLVEASLCAYCIEWAWGFRASLIDICGSTASVGERKNHVGRVDSPYTNLGEGDAVGDKLTPVSIPWRIKC